MYFFILLLQTAYICSNFQVGNQQYYANPTKLKSDKKTTIGFLSDIFFCVSWK